MKTLLDKYERELFNEISARNTAQSPILWMFFLPRLQHDLTPNHGNTSVYHNFILTRNLLPKNQRLRLTLEI